MSEKETFEDNLEALEALVNELEKGDLDLDKSLEIYERAVVLRDKCRKFLDESERRVQKIMETSAGTVTEDLDVP